MKLIRFIIMMALFPSIAITVFCKLYKDRHVIKFGWRSENPDVVDATIKYLMVTIELEVLYADSVARKILKVIVPILLFFLLFLL